MIAGVEDQTGLDRLRQQYERHAPALFRLGVALTGDRGLAEDLVHDAFVRLHRSTSPPVPDAERTYLRRTLLNLVRDHHRHLAVVRRIPFTANDEPSAELVAGRLGRDAAVAAAIEALPHRQRACVVLHYFEDQSDAEIAAAIGISTGSVKTHLHRARAALAAQLEDLR
jgi:RNA polymerase sigma-70 factor (ECF subfamily)